MTLTPAQMEERVTMVSTMRFDLSTLRGLARDCQTIARRAADLTTDSTRREQLTGLAAACDPLIEDAGVVIEHFNSIFGALPTEKRGPRESPGPV